MGQVTIKVPEDVDKKVAELIFELGLSVLKRDFHKRAEILAYFEARGWNF